ncbi:hypothetical protein OC844_005304, partial [Tilletia horrida]
DRAISALLRLNKDFRKVQRLVNADDDSVDSIDGTPSPAKESSRNTQKDDEQPPEKRVRMNE